MKTTVWAWEFSPLPLFTFILSRILLSTAVKFFHSLPSCSLSQCEKKCSILRAVLCGVRAHNNILWDEFRQKKSERNVLRAARKQMLMSIPFSYQFQNYGNNFFFLCVRTTAATNFFPFSFAFCWIATRILFFFLLSFSHVRLLYFLYLCTQIFILMDEMCSPCADECWATLCIYMNVFYRRSF